MQTRPMGDTGLNVSILGFGASPLGGVFGELDPNDGIDAVHTAIDLGINLFDVAPFYGQTRAETALGNALSTIPRERYVLATKVGRYGSADFDFSAARMLQSIDESLTRLQTDFIDIITCHDIEFVSIDQVINEAIPALERARQQGKVRFICVSGFPLKIYHTVLDRIGLDTVLSYCHNTLYDHSLEDHLDYLIAKGVGVINASPFGMGLLTGKEPPPWHPAGAALKNACSLAAEHCRTRGVSIAKLALQYAVANPRISTTLTGMQSRQEVESNVAWIQEPIDQDLLVEVQAILAPVQNSTWASGRADNN